MAKFCPYCGMPIPEGAKFCVGCGSKLAKPDALPETQPAEQPMNALSAATAAPASRKSVPSLAAAASAAKQGAETLGKIVGIDAPVTGGEFEAGPIEGLGAGELTKGVSEILAPLQTLFGGLRSAFGGMKALFTGKNFKGLVVTGALTLIWTLLLGFRQSGVNGSARNVLDTLFFGQGGVGSNPLCILGGALGKGAFAAAAASLLGGGWRSLGGGVKSLCSGKHFQKDSLPLFLLGAGIALAVYQLFAWKATCTDVMAAVSGAVLALIALGGRSSLLRRLIRSLTARKDGTGRIGQDGKCGALLAGLAAGFGLGIPLSLTGFGLTPLIVGGAALIAALVLLFVFRGRGGSGDGAASKRKTPENRSPRAPASASRQSLSRALLAGQALLLTLLLLGAALAEPVRVHASASEPTGYWEFVEIIEEQTESLTHVGYQYEETLSGSAVTGFVDRRVLTCEGYRYDDMGEEFRFHKGSCKGEFTEAVITFSPLPGARLDPGQELAITANAACSTSAHTVGVSGQTFIEYRYKLDGQGYIYFRSEETEGLNYVFCPEFVWQYEKPPYTAGGSRAVGDRTETYRATIPQGTPGRTEDLYIRFYIHIGSESISTYYHYRWVDTTPPPVTAAVTETPTTAPETELPPTDGHEHDGTGPIETDPWIVQIETRDADGESGEDAGTDIIPAIVTGLLNIGAAAGGVLLGGGEEEEEKKKKGYRMYVYKTFGNGVRKGMKPVPVWARIAEVIDGEAFDRPELTEKITVSGEGMDAFAAGMENSWMTAKISVPEDAEGEKAVLIFSYVGEGGVFRNRISFRVLGAPEIVFPGVTADGKSWDLDTGDPRVDMIAGDGSLERLRFVILNADEEPKEIRFETPEGLDITWEKDPDWQFAYYARVENQTEPIEKESGIFAASRRLPVRVEAEFEDGSTIWSSFAVCLYPEGLSVQGKLKDGRLLVSTVPLENPTEGFAKISPTVFSLTLAYPDGNGHTVVAEEPRWTPKELSDDGKYGLMFTDNFKYHIKYQSASELAFYPDLTLPSMGGLYETRLRVYVDPAWTGGQDYSADLPMALFGDEPELPSKAEWEKTLKRLKFSIRFYGIDSNPQVRKVLLHASEHSAAELENVRIHVIAAGVDFYRSYRDAYKEMDRLYTNYIVIAGSLVKAGDYAVKALLVKALGKTVGTASEHIINPLKNMLFTYLGEYIGGIEVSHEELEKRFFEALLGGVQDAICETITGDLKAAPENMGYAMAAFIMTSFTKHYWGYGNKEAKGDVFKSVIAACGDLALEKVKEWIGDVMKAGSKKLVETVSKWFGSYFINSFSGATAKAVAAAKDKAFEAGMKPLIKRGNVTTAEYLAVKASKEAAGALQEENMKQFLSYSAGKFAKNAMEAADIGLAAVLNFMLGGKLEDNKALGFNTKDLIIEFFLDRLGIKVENIKQTSDVYNAISFRFENDLIKLQLLDWGLDIPVFENLPVLVNMIMELCLGWMKMVWKYSFPTPGEVPDLRDIKEDAHEMIERQKELCENLKPIEYKYYGK